MKKRVLCLYRVSTIGQVDHDDIPMQRIACREFIAQHPDWELVDEVSEKGVSGYKTKTADRDALVQIKAKALAKKFDILLVFMFDRIGRRDDETPFVVQWFVENGIEVWSTKEGEQRFDNHVDKLLNYIRFWQASGESEKTSLRIRTKHLQMVQEGLYRGGLVPFGYKLEYLGRVNKKNQPVRDLVIDEREGAVVQEIFYKIVSDGWGTNRIANWLNSRGIPTKHGNSFWRGTSVRAVIRNPIYTGRIHFGDDLSGSFENLRLIDDDLFAHCDKLVREKAPDMSSERTTLLRSTSRGLLTGILYCGSCGCRMCFNHNRTTKRLADGTQKTYERDVYRCYRKISDHHGCTGRSTYSVERIEKDVLAAVRAFFENIKSTPTHEMLQAANKRSQTINQESLLYAEAALKKAQTEMAVLEEETVKALTGESKLDIDFINGLIIKRRESLENATAEVKKVQEQIENEIQLNKAKEKELNMIASWADAFEKASFDTKRNIVSSIISKVIVQKDYNVYIHYRIELNQFSD